MVYCMLNQNHYRMSFSWFWTSEIWIIYIFNMELLSVFFFWGGWEGGGGVGKLWKGFPLRGEGWHNWTNYIVCKNGHPHTTHHHSPSQFPKAEGCNSLVSSFFQPLLNSLSVSPLPLIPHSLISCEMNPFSGICGLNIADNHSLFPLPLSFSSRECCWFWDNECRCTTATQNHVQTRTGSAIRLCVCVCVCCMLPVYVKI